MLGFPAIVRICSTYYGARAGLLHVVHPTSRKALVLTSLSVTFPIRVSFSHRESMAGQKLASLLELMGTNDVLVVVSRWFGGTLLGPVRFKYIANVARELLEACGHGLQRKGAVGTSSKLKLLNK